MKNAEQMLADARSRIREITPAEALELHKQSGVVFLDVRDQNEVNLGRIPGAMHISRGNLETKVEALIPRDAQVVIYCASGNRSAFAADTLQQMGYANVVSLDGGFRDWAMNGGDVD